MKRLKRRATSALGFSCATLLAATCAAQDVAEGAAETSTVDIEQCVAEHDRAQQSRLREQWLAAREAMSNCAVARCPLAIASDCRAWLDELERVLPTLLIVIEREDPALEDIMVLDRGRPDQALRQGVGRRAGMGRGRHHRQGHDRRQAHGRDQLFHAYPQ